MNFLLLLFCFGALVTEAQAVMPDFVKKVLLSEGFRNEPPCKLCEPYSTPVAWGTGVYRISESKSIQFSWLASEEMFGRVRRLQMGVKIHQYDRRTMYRQMKGGLPVNVYWIIERDDTEVVRAPVITHEGFPRPKDEVLQGVGLVRELEKEIGMLNQLPFLKLTISHVW